MIFELQHGPISYDENRLSNLIYNLLTFSPSSETNFHITSLLDPDTNFYSDVDNCDYYTASTNLMKNCIRMKGILIIYLFFI
jgi:hypothetical protein